ncbi:MAG TPA: DUF3047 domain-containing protein [Ramlibacter sp.]|nr:DUF3047 domain-containing protein [Ramlibacter sp.]
MRLIRFAFVAAVALLAGCAGMVRQPSQSVEDSPWALQSRVDPALQARWQHYRLPGKAPTRFDYVHKDGREALAVTAATSASMVRKQVRVEPEHLGKLSFSWLVPDLIAEADLALRDKADSPVRVILAFDGDRSRWSARNAMLSELAQTLTGEPMPYATLIYVWCNSRPAGEVINSPRTDRIRKLVVESGPQRTRRWLDYERDIRSDYLRAFGEPPGALVGVAIMTDTDNTRSTARAWYGPVRLLPVAQPQH